MLKFFDIESLPSLPTRAYVLIDVCIYFPFGISYLNWITIFISLCVCKMYFRTWTGSLESARLLFTKMYRYK